MIANGPNTRLGKIDVLCCKVKAADRRSHCYNIWIGFIAHLFIIFQTLIDILSDLVGKVRAGHWGGRHVPCIFPRSPLSPPWGNSRPPPHQAVGRRRARAFLCSSPVTPPASFPSALRQGRRRPFPLPQGPAPPLLILARCFISRPHALCATGSAGSACSFH